MKTFTHVVLPIAIVVALVGVVAYVTQNASSVPVLNKNKDQETNPSNVAISGDVLAWDESVSEEEPRPMFVEFKSHNHKDFWFHNPHPQTVLMCAQRKSCTCTNLEVGTFELPDAELQTVLNKPSLTGWCKLASSVKFEPLIEIAKTERNRIPGTPQGEAARPYLLRLNWEAKKAPGEAPVDRLTTEVRAEIEGGTANVYAKDVTFVVAPSVEVFPRVLEVGDINRGSSGSTDFVVLSETRYHLNVKGRVVVPVEGSPAEPCGVLSEPIELTPEELKIFPQSLGERYSKMVPLCAYRFHVTLYEKKGDNQLDMGPVTRRVSLTFPPDRFEEEIEEARIPLNAVVKGEVRLVDSGRKDRIDLGSYKFDRGRKVIAILVAETPDIELELASTSSAKLHASLSPPQLVEGRRQWQLVVEMEPNALVGPMPASTMITLRTKGANPRLLRIPVTGKADR